jgi:hypothetical protein
MRRFRWGWVGLAGALGLIGVATLIPYPEQAELSRSTPLACLVCGDLGGVDVVLNLALFVPLGLALGALGAPTGRVLVVALTTSLAIELAQATLVAGRDPSLSDLLTNTIGAGLGSLLSRRLPQLWRPDRASAGRLALGACGAWLLLLAVSAWAVSPAAAPSHLATRQAPHLPMVDTFAGRIEAVAVAGSIPGGDIAITAVARLDGWTEHLAPVVDLTTSGDRVAARLGQLGQKVTFGVRSNASRIRLRPPSVKVYRALPPASGQRIELGGGLRGRRLWARGGAEGAGEAAELALTPGLGWLLLLPLTFYPFDYRPDVTTAAWVALPLVVAGFWTGRRAAWARAPRFVHGATSAAGAALLLVIGLRLLPELFGLEGETWRSWVASAIALALGWTAGRYAPGAASTSVPPSARSAGSP